MGETCFNCGTPMVDGVCPECGYQYPFAFECPYTNGSVCVISRRFCKKADQYESCQLWQQSRG